MTLGYKVYSTAAVAQVQAAAIWDRYATSERVARGLPAGASLDRLRNAAVEPPITVRYEAVVTASGETRACMAVDEFAAALHGETIRGTLVDTAGYVAVDALPVRLRDRVKAPATTTTTTARLR